MLVITGTGRCGTSALARLVAELGVPVGGGFRDDLRAGLEHPECVALNARINSELRSGRLGSETPDAIRAFRARVVKDPRFVSLPGVLEAWLDVRRDLRFVLMYREPAAVAVSAARAFNRPTDPASLARSAHEIQSLFERAVRVLVARGAPFTVLRWPDCADDLDVLRGAVCDFGRVPATPLALRDAWRRAFRPEWVSGSVAGPDPIGPSMRPGYPSYRPIGSQYVHLVRQLGLGLDEGRVLDVGCGYGRFAEALALAGFRGQYVGFDCYAPAVVDCARRFALNPAFQFLHLDVPNAHYNPAGTVPARPGCWPCADAWADVVIAMSVFTHLPCSDARAYMAEAARVLRPGGALLATVFAVDAGVVARLRDGDASLRPAFLPEPDACGVYGVPGGVERAAGYPVELLRRAVEDAGLRWWELTEGQWRGGSTPHQQDHLVCRKPVSEGGP